MRRSNVLSLPPQLVFPDLSVQMLTVSMLIANHAECHYSEHLSAECL
jgi:hypothetical protein